MNKLLAKHECNPENTMKSLKIIGIAVMCTIAPLCQVALAQNVGNFYTGKVKVKVVKSYSGAEALPKADKVLIQDFIVADGAVSLDESAAGRIHTRIFLHKDPDDASVSVAVAQQVQASFSKALIADLKKSDIEAQKSSPGAAATNGSVLIVSGEVTAINQGNKEKRVLIGLGRGGSDVRTHVTISSVTNGHATVVLELTLDSESGKKLGALESVGGGSIPVNAAEGAVSDRSSTVQAGASRMAKGVAKQIKGFMVDQKWIAAPSATEVASNQAPQQAL
jgi:hypothetical protein